MERYGGFLRERDCSITRANRVAGIFHSGYSRLAAGIDHADAADFCIGLACSFEQLALPWEHLILVNVFQRAHNLVFGAGAVPAACEVNEIVADELGRGGRL